MEVLLHVVQTASASPVSTLSVCGDGNQPTSPQALVDLSAKKSSTSCTVGNLRLTYRPAILDSDVAPQWHVRLCSPLENEGTNGNDGDQQVLLLPILSRSPPASPASSLPHRFVYASATSVDITDHRGLRQRPPSGLTTTCTVDRLCEKLRHLRNVFVREGCVGSSPAVHAETVFFCGSRLDTRKDVLYLTSLHRLLVDMLLIMKDPAVHISPHPPPVEVDVSLVDYDEVWGLGDVLAAEAAKASAGGGIQSRGSGITWVELASVLDDDLSPRSASTAIATSLKATRGKGPPGANSDMSATQVAWRVRQRLEMWFDRIDSATARFPSAPASPYPPAAADRLRHLERNAVFFTLRLRRSDDSSTSNLPFRASPAYFTLALLPECGAASPGINAGAVATVVGVSPPRSSAALWREFDALSAFMRSLPMSRHRRRECGQKQGSPKERSRVSSATVQAQMHAAALRRSRWLTTIARIHDASALPMRARAAVLCEESTDDAVEVFRNSTTVCSFSWVGCIAAAAEHRCATRSTLAFLARLRPPSTAQHSRPASVKGASTGGTTGTPLARHHRAHHKNISDDANDGDAPGTEDASCSSATPTPPLDSPVPSATVPQPYVSPRRQGGIARNLASSGNVSSTHVASHPNLTNEVNTAADPVAALPRGVDQTGPQSVQADALISSLQVYASVLEEEVRRLRDRLHRYEATTCDSKGSTDYPFIHSAHREVEEYNPADTPIPLSAPSATPLDICNLFPLLVRTAIDELRTDTRFPLALHAKLENLAQKLSSLCTAVFQVQASGIADVSATVQQQSESSEDRAIYVKQLEAKVALYEQKLALMDLYVAPTLVQCVENLDQWQQHGRQRARAAAARTEAALMSSSRSNPTLQPACDTHRESTKR
ncbi:hypothetical protein JKF63_05803 [Porcisia hertigi]|uniref:Uncharacterized protein n=1 Tax=Porcisia hertigi TaxID=2761500 RepID=A0A836HWG4_9TRYP|nr:hypothetical protein JKF63_05803 [Porcisia hertigi]